MKPKNPLSRQQKQNKRKMTDLSLTNKAHMEMGLADDAEPYFHGRISDKILSDIRIYDTMEYRNLGTKRQKCRVRTIETRFSVVFTELRNAGTNPADSRRKETDFL